MNSRSGVFLQNKVLMHTFFTVIFCLLAVFTLNAQDVYYVSQTDGDDDNSGLSLNQAFQTAEHASDFLTPGDTLYFVGEFVNESYNPNYQFSGNINDPHIWTQENTVRITGVNGNADNYITLKAYDENTVLRGDGANIFRIFDSSYLRIEDFEIYGEVENISLQTALDLQFLYRENNSAVTQYRVPPGTSDEEVENLTLPALSNISRPSYTDTRGIYLSNVNHIVLENNYVHHTPGNGFRVAVCDYIDIIGNEVHDCSRKSYSGTHGLVVASANSIDTNSGYKIRILNNRVHHNYNEIYSWAPTKTFITPRIDEGKGISLQRNDLTSTQTTWSHGRFLVANNLTYRNGYSGVHANNGLRMDFINNTAYLNQYTNDVTYAAGEQGGNNVGISVANGEDFRIYNNIVVVDAAWGAFPISLRDTEDAEVGDNLVYSLDALLLQDEEVLALQTNTTVADPRFIDPEDFVFAPDSDSPALGTANAAFAPDTDFYGNPRVGAPDLGAVEGGYLSGIFSQENAIEKIKISPNPCTDFIWLEEAQSDIRIFDVRGKDCTYLVEVSGGQRVEVSGLGAGVYYLRTSTGGNTFLKIN